jgi:hypothetical protein
MPKTQIPMTPSGHVQSGPGKPVQTRDAIDQPKGPSAPKPTDHGAR